jgi:hypothetical protein
VENTVSDAVLARIPLPGEKALIEKQAAGSVSVFMGAPVLADVDRIVDAEDWADGTVAITAQPATPCNLTYALTDANASITAGICTVVGEDPLGRAITEVFDMSAGLTLTGTKIFKNVVSVTISDTAGVPAAGVDVLDIGVGNVIGLPFDIDDEDAVQAVYVANTLTTPDAIATGESTSGIDCNGATYDGTKLMWAIVKPAYVGA